MYACMIDCVCVCVGISHCDSLILILLSTCMQWPEEEDLPGFKKTFLRYLKAVENLSNEFTGLVAEAFGLPSDGLAQFYGARANRIQHRSKVRLVAPPHTHQSLNLN